MAKPLSSLKYFKENKRKAIVVFITLFLAVLCVSFLTCLVKSIFVSSEQANIAPLEKFSQISSPNGKMFIEEDVITKIDKMKTTEDIYSVMINNTSIKTMFGNTSSPIIFIDDRDNLDEVISKTKCSLIKGRMPEEGEYEIIMHSSILRNKNLSVGDKFGDEIDSSEWVNGTYTIVGEFTGESVIGFATKNFYLSGLKDSGVDTDANSMYAIAFPENNNLDAMNNELEKLDEKEARITTKAVIRKMFAEQMSDINQIMALIIIVVTFGMSVSVGALIFTFYSARNDEFGILYALGYTKKNVRNLICKEIFSISLLSWALGYVASIGVLKIIDIVMFKPLGQSAILFSVYSLTYTLIIPAFVFICATFPILRSLSKKDLVTVIERRG